MKRFGVWFCLAVLLAVQAVLPVAAGSTTTVNTGADEDIANAACSLREAIIANNTDAPYNGCTNSDLIVFADTVATITLGGALPSIDAALTIDGGEDVTIDGDDNDQIFRIDSGPVTLVNLTLTDGSAPLGGAVEAAGSVVRIENSTLSRNNATAGGAIYGNANAEVTLVDVVFEENSAELGGALMLVGGATVSASGVSFSDNNAAAGGALLISIGDFTGTNVRFTENHADDGENAYGLNGGGAALVEYGEFACESCSFTDNSADVGGAVLGIGDVFYIGGARTRQPQADKWLARSASALVGGSPFTRVETTNSIFSSNSAVEGGAVAIVPQLTLFDGVGSARGGGAGQAQPVVLPSLTMQAVFENTAFVANSANLGGAIFHDEALGFVETVGLRGGGTRGVPQRTGAGAAHAPSLVFIFNATISGNSAAIGAGVYAGASDGGTDLVGFDGPDNARQTRIEFSTFANNNASTDGVDLSLNDTAVVPAVYIANSLFASSDSDGGNCDGEPAEADGFSISRDGSCGFGLAGAGMDNTDPRIGALTTVARETGSGTTQLHPLLPDSPAIDTASLSSGTSTPVTDQRELARPVLSGYDSGAYEFDGDLPPGGEDDEGSGSTPSGGTVGGGQVNFPCEELGRATSGSQTADGTQGNVSGSGMIGNTYCRVINLNSAFLTGPGEVGNADLLNLGVTQAVDLFGLLPGGVSQTTFNTPVRLCLRGTGAVFFINAADAVRSVQPLPVVLQANGLTCVDVPGAGTVVLVGGGTPQFVPAAPQAVSGCTVTTTAQVRLREAPNTDSGVITTLPFGGGYQVTAYVNGWYRVIYQNTQGWVSAAFVTTDGTCPG